MTEHAALGASSCYRWWACHGSIRLAASAPPSPPSRFALEGTAAHAVLAWCLRGGAIRLTTTAGIRSADETVGRPLASFVDTSTPSGAAELVAMTAAGLVEVDADMAEGVQAHIDYVVRKLHTRMLLQVEHRIDLTPLGPPVPMFGTADTILYDLDSETLEAVDFKYGRGVVVEVLNNPQLRYYGIGAWLDATAAKRKVKRVVNTIVQPRAPHPQGPIRSEEIDAMALYDWHTELMDAAAATQAPDAPLVAGDHCGFCPAAPICPAYRDAALKVASQEFSALPAVLVPAANELAIPDLVRILDGADLLEQWIDSVRSYAKHLLEIGETLPGWKLSERVGHRKWVGSVDEKANKELAVALTVTLNKLGIKGDDLFQPRELKSPAQMEKLLTKAQRGSEEFKALWHKPVTGSTMIRDNEKNANRLALPSSAARDFAPAASATVPQEVEDIDLIG